VGQDAQRRPRTLAAQPLAEANAWIERFRDLWEMNYERLDALLDELQAKPKRRAPKRR
jgi:hypothetical protein